MANNLLYIPFRLSTAIDIAKYLRDVISEDFFQSPDIFRDDLEFVKSARDAVITLKDEESTPSSEQSCKLYYEIVNDLIRKFPDTSIEFTWYNTLAYGRDSPKLFRSLKVESFNVLYQLGSYYSQAALQESMYTDNGLKESCTLLQQSAGCFEHLGHLISNFRSSDPDIASIMLPDELLEDTLKFLSSLMLAQAQERLWQKSLVAVSTKDSLISKLANATADMYQACIVLGKQSPYIKLEWINHSTVKFNHFKAAAYYRLSNIYLEKFSYGEQIAALRIASKYITSAFKHKRYVASFVIEDLKGLSEVVESTLRSSEKENDFIYLKPIPTEDSIPSIKDIPHITSKSIKEFLVTATPKKVLFNGLIPHVVIEVSQAFKERQKDFLNEKFIKPIEKMNQRIYRFLNERQLPSIIDSVHKPEEIPTSILKHSLEIISHGGLSFFDNSLTELRSLSEQVNSMIKTCKRQLGDEAIDDGLQSDPNIPDTEDFEESSGRIRYKIEMLEKYLKEAQYGDAFILEQYGNIKSYLEVYCGGQSELMKFLPPADFVEMDQASGEVGLKLRESVNEITAIEIDRNNLLRNVEAKSIQDSILSRVVSYYKNTISDDLDKLKENDFEKVYVDHLSLYSKDLKSLDDLEKQQIQLEVKIDQLCQRFVAMFHTSNTRVKRRQSCLQSLESIYLNYLDLISSLNEGMGFYSKLIQRATEVLQICESYSQSRKV